MRCAWFSAVCALLGGCGDNRLLPDHAQSGSRLKITWYDFGGGVRVPGSHEQFFDVNLDADCTPQLWADGRTYCTPETALVGYSDIQCTHRISRDVSHKYAIDSDWACDNWLGTHLYRVGATEHLGHAYGRNSLGECIEEDGPGEFAELIDDAPSLVEMERVIVSAHDGDRVAVEVLHGADGLEMPHLPYDRVLGSTCYVGGAVDATDTSCLAFSLPSFDGALFGDALCTKLASWVAPTCPGSVAPRAASDYYGGCPVYRGLGDETNARSVQGALCAATSPATMDEKARMLGPEISASRMSRAPDPTVAARVQPIYFTQPYSGLHYRDPFGLYDSLLLTECGIGDLMDGSSACIPHGDAYPITRYTDASCATEVTLIIDGGSYDSCVEHSLPRFVRYQGYRSIGPAYNGVVYDRTTMSGCQPTGEKLYTFGDPLDTRMFPRAIKNRDR